MPGPRLQGVVRHLGLAVAARQSAGVTDAQLLDRFRAQRDEAAFELLVWRHGKMVLGTCRRLLRDGPDAEDAFQACFLALARRAGSIGRGSVGGWLHKVAFRLALRAKALRTKHDTREQPLGDLAPPSGTPDPATDAGWREVRRVLDDEVNRLPDTYRVPFVLCCLEGRSNADAARELGCPVGTVESRLTRARERLRIGLSRRGVAPSASLLAALPGPHAGPAFVPAALVSSAARAATLVAAGDLAATGLLSSQVVSLTEGVLRAMVLTKLKAAAVVLLAAALAGTGTGVLAYHAATDQPGPAPGTQPSQPPAPADAARIARLIEQLGSDVFAERQNATKELEAIGAPAMEALRQAALSGDAERRRRAEEIVKAYQARLDAYLLLVAKRVQLVYKDTPLADAVADFKQKSGYDIALSDPDGKLKDHTITLDTGDVTFWKALDLFCQKAGLVEVPPPASPPLPQRGGGGAGGGGGGGQWVPVQPPAGGGGGGGGGQAQPPRPVGRGGGGGSISWPSAGTPLSTYSQILLTGGKRPALPTDDRTAVRIRVLDQAGPLGTPADGEILLTLEIAPEPRLRGQQVLAVQVRKAVDDQGQTLEQVTTVSQVVVNGQQMGGAGAGGWQGFPGGVIPPMPGQGVSIVSSGSEPTSRVRLMPVRFKKGERAAKSLAEISGTITAQVAEESKPIVTVDDILKATGKTIAGADGGSITVLDVSRGPGGQITVRFELTPPANLVPVGQSLRVSRSVGRVVMNQAGAAAPDSTYHELSLVDGRGVLLQPVALGYQMVVGKANEFSVTWQPEPGQGEPAKLVFALGKSVAIDVPFTLRNVPLP
jgi:RNA polymerase sigma factor (sigma-70 family)